MVHAGLVDGMVSGAAHTTADTIRPAFEIIRASPGVSVVSSVFFMCMADRVLVFGDCAVNPRPDAEQLADIAISSADTAARFGVEVRIAMLSYSTGESGSGEQVEPSAAQPRSCVNASEAQGRGPIQYDAAVDAHGGPAEAPGQRSGRTGDGVHLSRSRHWQHRVQGRAALRRRDGDGPVLQGLRKPINDLSRGCTVTDIVNTVAITAIQAQEAPGS